MNISQIVAAVAAVTNTGATPPEPAIGVVVATGIVIVFSILVLLFLLITVEGVIFKSIENKKKGVKPVDRLAAPTPAVPSAAATPTGAMAVQQGIPGEVIAAISAALACMEGGSRMTIRSVTRAKQGRSAWSNAAAAGDTEPF